MNIQYEKKSSTPHGMCLGCERQWDSDIHEIKKGTEAWHIGFGKDGTIVVRLCPECVRGLLEACMDMLGKDVVQRMFEGWCKGCKDWVPNLLRHDSVHRIKSPDQSSDVKFRICGPVTNFRFAGRGLK